MGKTKKGMGAGEIERCRGIELNVLKKMVHDREQYRKWINGPTLKGNRRK